MLRNPDDADDVAQEAMARAWRSRRSCRTPDAPLPWCLQITRNEALRLLGRRKSAPYVEELGADRELADSRAGDEAAETAARLDLGQAVKALTRDERTLIALRHALDYSHPQIAGILEIPEATARVRLFRAHKRLKAHLDEGS